VNLLHSSPFCFTVFVHVRPLKETWTAWFNRKCPQNTKIIFSPVKKYVVKKGQSWFGRASLRLWGRLMGTPRKPSRPIPKTFVRLLLFLFWKIIIYGSIFASTRMFKKIKKYSRQIQIKNNKKVSSSSSLLFSFNRLGLDRWWRVVAVVGDETARDCRPPLGCMM